MLKVFYCLVNHNQDCVKVPHKKQETSVNAVLLTAYDPIGSRSSQKKTNSSK